MSLWTAAAPTHGTVRGRAWNGKAGRSVTTHRRGVRAIVWVRREGRRDTVEVCDHAHKSRSAAEACGKSWARWKNANACCINCGVSAEWHDKEHRDGTPVTTCSNYEAPS